MEDEAAVGSKCPPFLVDGCNSASITFPIAFSIAMPTDNGAKQ